MEQLKKDNDGSPLLSISFRAGGSKVLGQRMRLIDYVAL